MGITRENVKMDGRRVVLKDLFDHGLIKADQKVFLTHKEQIHWGQITDDGKIRIDSGDSFDSPSQAAVAVVSDRQTANGWTMWNVDEMQTLADLREELPLDSEADEGDNPSTVEDLLSIGFATPTWWVSQGIRHEDETEGGFIWAPFKTAAGKTWKVHKNVGSVKKGDWIIHHWDKCIRGVSKALADGGEGKNPAHQERGWLGRVEYWEFDPPIDVDTIPLESRVSTTVFNAKGGPNQRYLTRIFDATAGTSTKRLDLTIEQVIRAQNPSARLISNSPSGGTTPSVPLNDVYSVFSSALWDAHIRFGERNKRHDVLVRRFMASLATKRFLILTGLSGSGKTKIAQSFGEWLGTDRYKIVAVRPDWTSPDHLLGYQNDLAEPVESRQPWVIPETLELINRAVNDQDNPYLLILDEMNLAHVERYFADILSGIESGAEVIPNITKDGVQDPNQKYVSLPKNLFIVGTVNVDETTYMFSPKVLDRANTIEFRVESEDLGNTAPTELQPCGNELASRFLQSAIADIDYDSQSSYSDWIIKLHKKLSKHDREFGHRSYAEMMEFRHHYVDPDNSRFGDMDAFDVQVYQKVLPRINGSQRDVGETIEMLAKFCFAGPDGRAEKKFDILSLIHI